MLKFFGGAMVISVCTFYGFLIANKYKQRPLELRNLRSMLNLLETEIIYASTPLPLALDKVAKHASNNISQLFSKARDYLINSNGITAGEAWQKAINDTLPTSYLLEEDVGILMSFGTGLGCSDKEEQLKNIQLTKELIKQQELKAEGSRAQHERLWRTMGFLAGVAIVLLIL